MTGIPAGRGPCLKRRRRPRPAALSQPLALYLATIAGGVEQNRGTGIADFGAGPAKTGRADYGWCTDQRLGAKKKCRPSVFRQTAWVGAEFFGTVTASTTGGGCCRRVWVRRGRTGLSRVSSSRTSHSIIVV